MKCMPMTWKSLRYEQSCNGDREVLLKGSPLSTNLIQFFKNVQFKRFVLNGCSTTKSASAISFLECSLSFQWFILFLEGSFLFHHSIQILRNGCQPFLNERIRNIVHHYRIRISSDLSDPIPICQRPHTDRLISYFLLLNYYQRIQFFKICTLTLPSPTGRGG